MSDAIPFVFRKFTMLVDGTIRMTVDVEPNDTAGVFKLFNEPNVHGAMVRLVEDEIDQPSDYLAKEKRIADKIIAENTGGFGEHARQLKLSGFFRCQSVWQHIGTDAEFLDWIRGQPCCVCDAQAPSEAAHVRRIANGAGTGIKPKYSAVPLCRKHHTLQHQKGESAIDGGSSFLDRQRIEHLECWGWETLKHRLGYQSWRDVPPSELAKWASDNEVFHLLPDCYKEEVYVLSEDNVRTD